MAETGTTLVSPEEYLHSTYEPDAEYVEGKIVHRTLPKKQHSRIQGYFYRRLYELGRPLGLETWVEQRIRTQINPPRYRVPDVCVTRGEPDDEVFTQPPILCVEVLSPDDAAIEVRAKIDEYLAFGVEHVWIVDPDRLGGEIYSARSVERVTDGVFRAGEILIDLKRA
jgi:Uma2 family endonuclease